MKKIIVLTAIISLSFTYAQEKKSRNYDEIIATLDQKIQDKESNSNFSHLNLEGKTFVLVKTTENLVKKDVVNFTADHKLSIVEFTKNLTDNTQFTKFYEGDYIKRDTIISVRADVLEGKKIGVPLTYNFMLKERDLEIFLVNLNNNEKWLEAASIEKQTP